MKVLAGFNLPTTTGAAGLQIITSGDMATASVTSTSFTVQHTPLLSVEYVWTGTTPVGAIQLQGSVSGLNWFNVGSSVAVTGNSGTAQLSDANAAYNYARVVYTKTSGTGTINAYAQAKGV